MRKQNQEGSVLILAIGILTVLVMIAITLTIITMLNATSTSAYIDHKLATEIAMTGIQECIRGKKLDALDVPVDKEFLDNTPLYSGYREDFADANFNMRYDTGEILYRDNDLDGVYDFYTLLENNPTPSFWLAPDEVPGEPYANSAVLVKGNNIDEGILIGISGFTEVTRSPGNEFYSLKVLPCSGQIYINGPCTSENILDYNVIGMLNSLGSVLTTNTAYYTQTGGFKNKKDEAVNLDNLGYLVAALRIAGPFYTENDLKDAGRAKRARELPNPFAGKAGGIRALNETECEIVKDFVTTYMWIDYTTLNPSALVKNYPNSTDIIDSVPAGFAAMEILNTGCPQKKQVTFIPRNYSLPQTAFAAQRAPWPELAQYGMCPSTRTVTTEKQYMTHLTGMVNLDDASIEEPPHPLENPLLPDKFIQPRSPVNINVAPREVLYAVLYPVWPDTRYSGLTAVQIDKASRTTVNPGAGKLAEAFSTEQAAKVVEKILEYRRHKPFTTWSQFNRFTEDELADILTPAQRAVLRANANPNSNLTNFNPDRNLGGTVTKLDYTEDDPQSGANRFSAGIDKDNLITWSTEFCFHPMGYYEIESIGRVCAEVLDKKFKGIPVKKVLSEKKVRTILCLYDVYKHSTQRDFEYVSKQNIQGALYECDSRRGLPDPQNRSKNTVSFPENMANFGAFTEITEAADKSASNDFMKGALFDGYVQVMPNNVPYNNGPRGESVIFASDLDDTFDAIGNFSSSGRLPMPIYAMGTVEEKRSCVDNAFLDSAGSGIYEDSLVMNLLRPDGFFSNETFRFPYWFASSPELEPYGTGPFDEYLRYNSGITNDQKNGLFRQTGTLEFWFKPSWDSHEQFQGDLMADDTARDARVFFSMGTGKGVIRKVTEAITTFRRLSRQPQPVNGPNESQVLLPPENRLIIRVEEYSSQVVFFAANRELNLYFSDNLEYNKTDETGTFNKVSIQLDSLPWKWRAGTWHHLAFTFDGTKPLGVYLDGYPAVNTYAPSSPLYLTDEMRSMFIACNRVLEKSTLNGNPANADGTIDSVRIYNASLASDKTGFKVPDRYDSKYEPFSEYYFKSAIVDFGKYIKDNGKTLSGTIGTVFWTEYMPIASGGGDISISISANDAEYLGSDEVSDGGDAGENGSFIVINKQGNFGPETPDNTIKYCARFKLPQPPDGLNFVVETPILDDIYVTFMTTPRIIAQWEESVHAVSQDQYTMTQITGLLEKRKEFRKERTRDAGNKPDITPPDNKVSEGDETEEAGDDDSETIDYDPKPLIPKKDGYQEDQPEPDRPIIPLPEPRVVPPQPKPPVILPPPVKPPEPPRPPKPPDPHKPPQPPVIQPPPPQKPPDIPLPKPKDDPDNPH